MKVAHMTDVWLPQTQTWIFNQVKYLPINIESYIVTEKTENLSQFELPRIHSFHDNRDRLSLLFEKALRKYGLKRSLFFTDSVIKKIKPDIIHSNFGPQGWRDIPVVRKNVTKHVTTFYGYDINKLPYNFPKWHKRYKELFSACHLFLCEGNFMASQLMKQGCPSHKIIVHHLGVEVNTIKFQPRKYFANDKLKILIASRFQEKKGITYAIDALALLSKNYDIELSIIGDAQKSPESQLEKEKILKSLETNNLLNKCKLLGILSHKRTIEEAYKNHLFLSPSLTAKDGDSEGGAPVTIIEMVATGIPVISTMHCDIPEVLNYGENGFLAHEADVHSLVTIIEKWLNELGQWDQRLIHARDHIQNEYNAVLQGVRLGDLYKLAAQ